MKSAFTFLALWAVVLTIGAQPYTVGIKSITYQDPARSNRSIPVDFRFPGTNTAVVSGQFPFVVFAHGFSMGGNSYYNYGDTLAKQGYIVALLRTEEGLSPSHPNFAQDLIFIYNKLIAENTVSGSFFYQHVVAKGAIGGHSMGAGSTVLSAQYSTPAECYFTFAAATTNPSSITAAPNLTKPYLAFAGSRDCIAPYGTNQLPHYQQAGSSCKYMINIKDALHCQFNIANTACSFGEGTSGCASSPLTRAQQFTKVMTYLVPFLDYYLKGDCNAWTLFETRYNTNTVDSLIRSCNNVVPTNASISGSTQYCTGSTTQLTANPSGFNYQWTDNSTAQNLNVGTAGTFGVSIGNGTCTLPQVSVNVAETSPPSDPVAIVSADTLCATISNAALSITLDPVATNYNWTVPAGWTITSGSGTNQITVTTGTNGGAVQVTAQNQCGTSAAASKNIVVVPTTLGNPGVIGGSADVCVNIPITYSVSAVAGATSYSWTLPSGFTAAPSSSNSITVTAASGAQGGVLEVVAQNECGSSQVSDITLTVAELPALSPVSGPASVCLGEVVDYSVVLNGIGAVNWSTGNFQVQQGSGTPIITVKAVAAGNTALTPVAQNSCGSVNGTAFNVSISDTPVVTIIQSGSDLIANVGNATIVGWYNNGQQVAGAVNSFTPTQDGVYEIATSNANGCNGRAAFNFLSIGLSDLASDAALHLLPNPARGLVTVQMSSHFIGSVLRFTDLQGRVVLQRVVNHISERIDLSALPAAVYLISVQKEGAVIRQRLVLE